MKTVTVNLDELKTVVDILDRIKRDAGPFITDTRYKQWAEDCKRLEAKGLIEDVHCCGYQLTYKGDGARKQGRKLLKALGDGSILKELAR